MLGFRHWNQAGNNGVETAMSGRRLARKLASEAIEAGCPLEWYDRLYPKAAGDESDIPWADMSVNQNRYSRLDRNKLQSAARILD